MASGSSRFANVNYVRHLEGIQNANARYEMRQKMRVEKQASKQANKQNSKSGQSVPNPFSGGFW